MQSVGKSMGARSEMERWSWDSKACVQSVDVNLIPLNLINRPAVVQYLAIHSTPASRRHLGGFPGDPGTILYWRGAAAGSSVCKGADDKTGRMIEGCTLTHQSRPNKSRSTKYANP